VEQIDFLFVHVPKKSSFYKPLGDFMNITFMPMGIFAMSDFLNRNGFSSQIVHLGVEWIEDTGFSLIEWLKDKQVKVIGMPIHWHYQAYDTMDVAKKIKAQYPGIRIVLGGFTASFFAREILENFSCIDAVVRGDGERPVVEFMKALSGGDADFSPVPNLTWRRGAEIVENPLSYVAEKKDLDELNFTNLKLLKNYPTYVRSFSFPLAWMKNFSPERNVKHHSIGTSLFPLAIGRGCPVNCSFCGGSYEGQLIISGRKKVVFREPEKVVESMEQAKSYGYQTMSVCYDPTPKDDRYFQELFKLIRKKNLGLDWYFECWALPTKRFMEAFKETFPGKYSILAISAESSAERVRKLNKGFFYSNKELYETLDFMKEKNIFLDMFFTVGIPHETIEEAMQTKEMMATISHRYKKILKRMMVWTIQIEPGAPQFLHPEKYGIVSDRSTFMDFYRSHGGQDSDTYSALGYYNNTFFTGAAKQYNAHEFSEEMQKLKCDHFCFLHPDASKYNTPFKGRMYCTYRSLYWKLKGLDKKPAKRDVFT